MRKNYISRLSTTQHYSASCGCSSDSFPSSKCRANCKSPSIGDRRLSFTTSFPSPRPPLHKKPKKKKSTLASPSLSSFSNLQPRERNGVCRSRKVPILCSQVRHPVSELASANTPAFMLHDEITEVEIKFWGLGCPCPTLIRPHSTLIRRL